VPAVDVVEERDNRRTPRRKRKWLKVLKRFAAASAVLALKGWWAKREERKG